MPNCRQIELSEGIKVYWIKDHSSLKRDINITRGMSNDYEFKFFSAGTMLDLECLAYY